MKSSMSEDLNNPVSVGDSGPVLSLVELMLINMTATQYISLVKYKFEFKRRWREPI